MTELKQQNTKNPDLQENFIIDDLTQKIQSISEDINQLKKWLNTLTIDQQNEEIDIIEKTISECLDELTNLEIDGESSIDKKQLEELKIQIDKLTESKENIKLTYYPIYQPTLTYHQAISPWKSSVFLLSDV